MSIRAVRRCSGAGLWSIERPVGRSAGRPSGWTFGSKCPRKDVAERAWKGRQVRTLRSAGGGYPGHMCRRGRDRDRSGARASRVDTASARGFGESLRSDLDALVQR